MFRSRPGGWSVARQAVFALVPVVIGAGLLFVSGDGATTGTLRLEATQSSVSPLLEGPFSVPSTVAAPPATSVSTTVAAGPLPSSTTVPSIAAADDDAPAATTVAPETVAEPAAVVDVGATSAPSDSTDTTTVPTTASPSTTQVTTTTTTTTTAPPPPATPARAGRSRDPGAEAEVVPLTNQDRAAAGLGTLSRNACLDSVASGYAEQMARSGVMAHNPGAGAAVAGCRPNPTWGDNVGTAAPCDTAFLEEKWMASPSHRRNILTGEFTLIGVGAWTDAKGACWVQVLFSS